MSSCTAHGVHAFVCRVCLSCSCGGIGAGRIRVAGKGWLPAIPSGAFIYKHNEVFVLQEGLWVVAASSNLSDACYMAIIPVAETPMPRQCL